MNSKLFIAIGSAVAIAAASFYFLQNDSSDLPETGEDLVENTLDTNNENVTPPDATAEEATDLTLTPGEFVIERALPETPRWWHSANVYQIWVRSFYDSNNDGHGDIQGITQKLDYIQSLGVDTIWLSPIFESPSHHGYDVTDFRTIEEDFGSMQDFETLLSEAKSRNIKIILDIALNHISEYHDWFLKALEGNEEYSDYFIWRNAMPKNQGTAWKEENNPSAVWHSKEDRDDYYYAVFGWTQPDLNYRNPKVKSEIFDVLSFWLNKGVNGFRLDALRYLIEDENLEQADTKETIALIRELSAHVKAANPEALLVGEVLTNNETIATYYDKGLGIDQAFDFNVRNQIEGVILPPKQKDEEAMPAEQQLQFASAFQLSLWDALTRQNNQKDAPDAFYASFLNNHDLVRANSAWGTDANRAKIAAALAYLRPGPTYTYYGEEVGQGQYDTTEDVYKRSIMQWDSSDTAGFNENGKRWLDNGEYFYWLDNFSPWWKGYWEQLGNRGVFNVEKQLEKSDSILAVYKQLLMLRKSDEVIHSPKYVQRFDNTGNVWTVRHVLNNETRVFVINLNPDAETLFITPTDLIGEYKDLINESDFSLKSDYLMAPGQFLVLSSK